jgi:hypothetical protein
MTFYLGDSEAWKAKLQADLDSLIWKSSRIAELMNIWNVSKCLLTWRSLWIVGKTIGRLGGGKMDDI